MNLQKRVNLKSKRTREKKILEQLSRPQYLQGFEIFRAFLRAKQVEISKTCKYRCLLPSKQVGEKPWSFPL